jgi:MtN3 and saliva related transmembrane protein
MTQYLGFVAGIFTTFCYIPQLMRVFRLKSAREISALYTVLILSGTGIWLIYGILINNPPLIVWNAIAFIFLSLLLTAKFLYGRNKEARAPGGKDTGAKVGYQKT